MHSYHHPDALEPLATSDPELWREIYGTMQVCLYEDDEADLHVLVSTAADIPAIQLLGTPEETASIIIRCQGEARIIHRIIPDGYRAAHLAGLDSVSAPPPTGCAIFGWSG